MADFPTLSINPQQPLTEDREDAVIRSPMEAGYVKTRARFTRSRKAWRLVYENMTNTDKESLATFYDDTVGHGADSFTWVHPTTSASYTVRFKAPPKFINTVLTYWNVELEVEEV